MLSLLVITLMVSSCGIGMHTNKTMRTGTLMPNSVRLDVTLDDFELLGEMEVSVQYHQYLGFFKVVNEMNGQPYDRRHTNRISMVGYGNIPISANKYVKEAMYQAHIKMPDADFLVPVNMISEVNQMLGGRKVKTVVKVKAYKIKDN